MSGKVSFPPWKEEVAQQSFRQAVIAEFIATFMFLFCTIGCVVFTQDGGITTARQLEVSLVFGAMITILVFIMAGISGGNINPAVTWALLLTRKISPVRAVMYTGSQLLGAICGAGFVRIMTPAMFDKVDGGANEINPSATSQEALGVEFGCTGLLVLTVMAATDSHRADTNKHIPTIAPIVIGLAVTAAHFIAIPVDNCSINPARTFGVAAISGNWNDHWVFWFGPYLGATAAALVYYYLLEHPDAGKASAAPAAAPAAIAAASSTPAAMFVGKAGSDAERLPVSLASEAVEAAPIGGLSDNEWR
jgi:aquaporin PIP